MPADPDKSTAPFALGRPASNSPAAAVVSHAQPTASLRLAVPGSAATQSFHAPCDGDMRPPTAAPRTTGTTDYRPTCYRLSLWRWCRCTRRWGRRTTRFACGPRLRRRPAPPPIATVPNFSSRADEGRPRRGSPMRQAWRYRVCGCCTDAPSRKVMHSTPPVTSTTPLSVAR